MVQKNGSIGWDFFGPFHKYLKLYEDLRYEVNIFWLNVFWFFSPIKKMNSLDYLL